MATQRSMVTTRLGLLNEVADSAKQHIDAAPATVWGTVTDVTRLPEWNAAIESVIEDPGPLRPGAHWVVLMHPRGWPRWRSRSTVSEIDGEAHHLSYTTQTDDGNPSSATWAWRVAPSGAGSEVSVSWRLHPRTLGRRTVIGRMRRSMLVREVDASLRALAALVRREELGPG